MLRKILAAACFALLSTAAYAQNAGITPCSPASISVSGTSANTQLSACGPTVIVYNIGTQEAFYKPVSASTGTATTSDYSLPGSSYVVLQISQGAPGYLAAITASSTTTLRIVQGSAKP